jgi:hypothetical protein
LLPADELVVPTLNLQIVPPMLMLLTEPILKSIFVIFQITLPPSSLQFHCPYR